jgi:hypothetical protein
MKCTFVAIALVLADLAMAAEGSQPSLKIVNSVVQVTPGPSRRLCSQAAANV